MRYQAKALIVVIILILAALIFIPVKNSVSHKNKTPVTIEVAPTDSKVTINGTPAKAGVQYLAAGSYEIRATRSGFADDSKNIKVQQNQPISVYLIPTPNTPEALNWLKANPDEQAQREILGGKKFNADQAFIKSTYPLLQKLPQQFPDFSIGYEQSVKYPNDPTRVAININSTFAYGRQQAIQWIQAQGYDPADYEIVFDTFLNPFAGNPGD